MSKSQLKEVGLKATLPRMKILSILSEDQDAHFSAEAIYHVLKETDQDVSLATVYRVLSQFESAGLIKRHRFDENHSVYELNNGDHHDHLVCMRCGAVVEFVDEVIEKRQKDIAQRNQFQLVDHQLYLYGICSACQA